MERHATLHRVVGHLLIGLAALAASTPRTATANEGPAFPTPGELRQRDVERQARRAATLLEALPGVERAEVRLVLPDPTREPLDAPARASTASVAVQAEPGAELDRGRLARLVAGAVAGLEAGGIEVAIARSLAEPAPEPVALPQVGPFAVAPDSAPALRAVLAVVLLLNAGLALALVAVLRRARRGEAER